MSDLRLNAATFNPNSDIYYLEKINYDSGKKLEKLDLEPSPFRQRMLTLPTRPCGSTLQRCFNGTVYASAI